MQKIYLVCGIRARTMRQKRELLVFQLTIFRVLLWSNFYVCQTRKQVQKNIITSYEPQPRHAAVGGLFNTSVRMLEMLVKCSIFFVLSFNE